jgi:DNA-binding response OmpR family regulator
MNEKILVIDHERDILKSLETLLTREGFQVRGTSGGEEAISVLASESFDLVIMDIRIPKVEGVELMKRIKHFDEEIEVIVLTGAVSVDNAIKALRYDGAVDFLIKPLDNMDKLIISVRQALRKRMLNKEKKARENKLEQYYLEVESRTREFTHEISKVNEEMKTSLMTGGQYRIPKKDLDSFIQKGGIHPLANHQPLRNKVLIVDDEPLIRQLLTDILSIHDYEKEVASDGFEAGTKIMKFKPDLIILDLIMPGLDGFEVCRRIREDPDTSHIKILAITGFDTKEHRKRIMEAGADGYLAKPVAKDMLLQNVAILLDRGEKFSKKISA